MPMDFLSLLLQSPLNWLQVEVTTHHHAAGVYSLYKAFETQWRQEHMSLELFHALKPAMRRAGLVHLQGWGEPLLHPRFADLLAAAKSTGARVTTAVHKAPLDEDQAEVLVKAGLNSLTLHLSGPDLGSKAPGTELGDLLQSVDTLARVKARRRSPLPAVFVLCTVTRPGLAELPRLPGLLSRSGVSLLIVNPLPLTADPQIEDQVLVPANDVEFRELSAKLLELKGQCRHAGFEMHFFLLNGGQEPRGCIERAHRSAFVSARGEVSPCAFCGLPVEGEAAYRFQGLDMSFPQYSFGRVGQGTSFFDVWQSPGHRRFRKSYARGEMPGPCEGCWRPYLVAQ